MKTGKFWNGYEIDWCQFCKGYNISCLKPGCGGSVCACHGCEECTPVIKEFLVKYEEILANTGLDKSAEYLSRNSIEFDIGWWTAYDDTEDYSV